MALTKVKEDFHLPRLSQGNLQLQSVTALFIIHGCETMSDHGCETMSDHYSLFMVVRHQITTKLRSLSRLNYQMLALKKLFTKQSIESVKLINLSDRLSYNLILNKKNVLMRSLQNL